MHYFTEYLTMSYFTLIMLAGFAVVLIANRKAKINGTQYIWVILGLVFSLTVLNYIEYWASAYHKSDRWLYFKTSLTYCIYPLFALLELYLIAPVKRKLILTVPYIAFIIIEIADFFDAHITYFFNGSAFWGGEAPLRPLPFIMDCLYVVILAAYSAKHWTVSSKAKNLIVLYMAASTILTALLEFRNKVTNLTDAIVAFDMIIYYVYLAAIQHSETQTELHRKELELEKSKLTLLVSQIKPHFINNALLSIREYCYEDPEKAADLVTHFAVYLRNNITGSDSDSLIEFTKEIEAVKEYLSLEYADSTKKFRVEYDLGVTDFMIPPLSVQPFVENAVKHGIDRYSPKALVKIVSYEKEEGYYIEVRDNGKGFDMNEETLGKGGIGFKNAAARLDLLCGGTLDIKNENGWTSVIIGIKKE